MFQRHINQEDPTRVEITMEHMVCGGCGCMFALPTVVLTAKRQQGEPWFCPNGHMCTDEGGPVFSSPQEDTRSLSQALRRLGTGVCPYCKKAFKRLDRHLAWKHQEEQMRDR
jgi:hypothetical protein